MYKTFKIKAFGAGLAHGADFVNGKLARQDNPVCAKLFGLNQTFGMGEVGQGGEKKPPLKARLTGKVEHGQILHNEAVGPHLTGQTGRQPVGLRGLSRFDQSIHGHIDARVFCVREVCEARKFSEPEIFSLHAGRKMLEAQIDGVCTGGKGGQK